ncbi:phage virion morphogenesis protein [Pasteurella bettyae]|uniref:Phage virion morphogenesis protein n=1 Tax=Pasteurella bettyae CCUG 2042 TaxID=1095749 RepID=I3DCI7_9PAST|nr:phage virion morphogenesis protein [Pasteurella bettyae]EIJ69430.1 phage virion morphogenesis protein [Pasteurella bettyae CCUG 2042]SUB20760.1 Mu-like prophage protein gpG [Pasteurella bettyae]SUB21318.1 Mu-like prophage protein gpG [Pasteurella bettyae]
MSDNILQVKTAFSQLLANISKPRRRLLYQQIGRELARSQRRRIKAQQNPDGTAYEPRKQNKVRSKKPKNRVKNKMFKKITSPSHLKLKRNDDGLTLGFSGGDAAIANVHQHGLKSRISDRLAFKVKYAQRELLGFTDEDVEMIENYVIKALSDSV